MAITRPGRTRLRALRFRLRHPPSPRRTRRPAPPRVSRRANPGNEVSTHATSRIIVSPSANSAAMARLIAIRWSPRLETTAPRSGAPPCMHRLSAVTETFAPSRPNSSATAESRSTSFTRSSPAPVMVGLAVGQRRRHRQDRHLVDQPWNQLGADPHAAQSAPRRPTRSATGSPPRRASASCRIRGAHPLEHVQDARPRRIHAHVPHAELPRHLRRGRATRKNAAEDRSPGTLSAVAASRAPPVIVTVTPSRRGVDAEGRQHPLGVVAREERLGDARLARRPGAPASRMADLDLRAGHRRVPGDARGARRPARPAEGTLRPHVRAAWRPSRGADPRSGAWGGGAASRRRSADCRTVDPPGRRPASGTWSPSSRHPGPSPARARPPVRRREPGRGRPRTRRSRRPSARSAASVARQSSLRRRPRNRPSSRGPWRPARAPGARATCPPGPGRFPPARPGRSSRHDRIVRRVTVVWFIPHSRPSPPARRLAAGPSPPRRPPGAPRWTPPAESTHSSPRTVTHSAVGSRRNQVTCRLA